MLCAACALAFMASPAPARCTVSGLRSIHTLTADTAGPVHARGVVTAVFPALGGYFIEAPHAAWDDDTATTEGLFVYGGRHLPTIVRGEMILLAGRMQAFHGMPELAGARILKRCGRTVLPPPVSLHLPPMRSGGWKNLLGMRVRFVQPLFVSGLDDFVRYGEVHVSADRRLYAPTARTAPGPAALALARAGDARSLWLDDGKSHARARILTLADHRFDAAHPLRAGQKFDQLTGIAYYAFGRYLIEVTSFELDRGANRRLAPDSLGMPAGLRIVSFNVENYFNRSLAGSASFPTERGARTATGFSCQRAKLVAALASLHPALAGLQEVENNGYGPQGALAGLVAALNRSVPDAPYRFLSAPARRLGEGLIAPAFVYDVRRLAPVGRVAVLPTSGAGLRYGNAAATGLARPVLAASFRVRASGLRFSAAVVHLRSKRSSCGGALDDNKGAGNCAVARAAASVALTRWLATRPTGVETANRILLGDFNAYPHEAAITRLKSAGWLNLVARYVAPDTRYTESYRGRVGELDYVFASPSMASQIAGAAVWHSDTDEARGFGYEGAMPACRGDAAAYRASDHDPVIVVLKPR